MNTNRIRVYACAFVAIFFGLRLQSQDLPLMPWPAKIVRGDGHFAVDTSFTVIAKGAGADDPRVLSAINRFLAHLEKQAKIAIPRQIATNPAIFSIVVDRPNPGVQKYGDDESYRLTVTPQTVRLTAAEPLGERGARVVVRDHLEDLHLVEALGMQEFLGEITGRKADGRKMHQTDFFHLGRRLGRPAASRQGGCYTTASRTPDARDTCARD
jgi:hypothetical protein